MNYTDENRGLIQYRKRAKQLIKWDGIRLAGNITPSDVDGYFEYRDKDKIDGCIEYHDKIFIFYEVKGADVEMPRGQEVALKRLVDALSKARKYSVLFVCEHNVPNPEDDIDGAETIVRDVYVGSYGLYSGHGYTAKEATDIWVDFCKRHGR